MSRVLVIDDDAGVRESLSRMLAQAGYSVRLAESGDEGFKLARDGGFDVILSDMKMPGLSGLEVLRKLRDVRVDASFIIMTGFDESMMEIEAGRYGATFVRKPVTPSVLLDTVARCLEKVRRQRRWMRKRVVGGFRVTANGRPAAVMDVSYGGLRLEIPNAETLPSSFDVEVAGIGLHLAVDTVWIKPSRDGSAVECGAALNADATPAARTWRAIVDRLSA